MKASIIAVLTVSAGLLFTSIALPAEGDGGGAREGWNISAALGGSASFTRYDNWQMGDVDNSSFNGIFDLSGTYLKGKNRWTNTFKAEYGVSKVEDQVSRKGSDQLALESIYRYQWRKHVRPFAQFTATAPAMPGYLHYDDPVTALFDRDRDAETGDRIRVSGGFEPLNLSEGVGLEFNVCNGEGDGRELNFRIGAAAKQLVADGYYIENDDEDTEEVEFTLVEKYEDVGADAAVELKLPLHEHALLGSRLTGFYGFVEEFWKAEWETSLVFTLNKFLGVTITGLMYYDELVIDKAQWKTGTLLTLNYQLF
ncbi:DUF3078 domain-containing protein [bacterium]|nr:DUF3078 domain-containing protein [candidate division CSSED10-310 bacterium]